MSRRDFVLNVLLKKAENTASELNATLERKVQKRTLDLKIAVGREKDLVHELELERIRLNKNGGLF